MVKYPTVAVAMYCVVCTFWQILCVLCGQFTFYSKFVSLLFQLCSISISILRTQSERKEAVPSTQSQFSTFYKIVSASKFFFAYLFDYCCYFYSFFASREIRKVSLFKQIFRHLKVLFFPAVQNTSSFQLQIEATPFHIYKHQIISVTYFFSLLAHFISFSSLF